VSSIPPNALHHAPPPDTYTPSLHDALPIYSNGARTDYEYDDAGNLLHVHHPITTLVDGRTEQATESYTYDSMGRITSYTDAEGEIGRHTSELQSLAYLVCRLLLEKKNRLSK